MLVVATGITAWRGTWPLTHKPRQSHFGVPTTTSHKLACCHLLCMYIVYLSQVPTMNTDTDARLVRPRFSSTRTFLFFPLSGNSEKTQVRDQQVKRCNAGQDTECLARLPPPTSINKSAHTENVHVLIACKIGKRTQCMSAGNAENHGLANGFIMMSA